MSVQDADEPARGKVRAKGSFGAAASDEVRDPAVGSAVASPEHLGGQVLGGGLSDQVVVAELKPAGGQDSPQGDGRRAGLQLRGIQRDRGALDGALDGRFQQLLARRKLGVDGDAGNPRLRRHRSDAHRRAPCEKRLDSIEDRLDVALGSHPAGVRDLPWHSLGHGSRASVQCRPTRRRRAHDGYGDEGDCDQDERDDGHGEEPVLVPGGEVTA